MTESGTTPNQEGSDAPNIAGVSTADAVGGLIVTVMTLLPYLHIRNSLDGRKYIEAVEDVSSKLAALSSRPGILKAVQNMTSPLRETIEKQNSIAKEAAAQENTTTSHSENAKAD